MEPAIQTGAIIVIAPANDYNTNDVITFNLGRNDIPTTHRIIDERIVGGESRYVTKGDANEERDPQEVANEDIEGKVLFSVPFVGYVLDFARQPFGFAILIGVPAAYIALEEGINIFTEVKKARKRKEDDEESENTNDNT